MARWRTPQARPDAPKDILLRVEADSQKAKAKRLTSEHTSWGMTDGMDGMHRNTWIEVGADLELVSQRQHRSSWLVCDVNFRIQSASPSMAVSNLATVQSRQGNTVRERADENRVMQLPLATGAHPKAVCGVSQRRRCSRGVCVLIQLVCLFRSSFLTGRDAKGRRVEAECEGIFNQSFIKKGRFP